MIYAARDVYKRQQYKRPVVDIIAESFPYSFELGIRALIFAAVMGVLLGIVAAVKRGTAWDTGSMLIAMVGVSVPSFIVGALLQYFFSVKLFQWTGMRLFPVTGWTTEMSKLLPAFALSFGTLASISRLMRSSTLDVLSSDYVKTAKAKGLSQAKIIWRHVVRNAIMPIVTVLGPDVYKRQLGISLIGLNEIRGEIPKVNECGKTMLENAEIKAKAYYEAFQMPVFSCDSGLYFDEVKEEEQPGLYVRRVNGRELSDDEMLEYYSSLAGRYGGKITGQYRNAIYFMLDENHCYSSMDKSIATEPFILSACLLYTSLAHRVEKRRIW